MKKPNFLMVGAPKAGTTSIANYLQEHPKIFISEEKEPFYFLPNILQETNKKDPMYGAIENRACLSPKKYYSLFENATTEKKLGEATVHYLYHYKEVIPRVKKELGDISIIIILRNPALRAFSNYKFQSRGQINSFEEALALEEERKKKGFNSFWYYKDVGNYFRPVKAYMDNFTNVHVVFFEDFKKDPITFMQNMYDFLEVDKQFIPNTEVKHNPTIVPKSRILHYLYYIKNKFGVRLFLPNKAKKQINKLVFRKNNDEINPETNIQLKNYFKNDILKLEKLLKKDLAHWYE